MLIMNIVAGTGVDHQVKPLVRLLQRPYQLKGVGGMDIVIPQSMHD